MRKYINIFRLLNKQQDTNISASLRAIFRAINFYSINSNYKFLERNKKQVIAAICQFPTSYIVVNKRLESLCAWSVNSTKEFAI